MANPDIELRSYLESLQAQMAKGQGFTPPDYAYTSPVDFLLQHGRDFLPRPLPSGIHRGLPKHCFGNAIVAAVLHDLTYVEGYALLNLGAGNIPFEHAWCTDLEGRLYEVTWPRPGTAYVGVEFSVERADDCTWNGDANVLNDWKRKYPLLRARWSGEPLLQRWPPSARLEVLYREKARRARRTR